LLNTLLLFAGRTGREGTALRRPLV